MAAGMAFRVAVSENPRPQQKGALAVEGEVSFPTASRQNIDNTAE
jgi:hypothetical protein